LINRLQLKITRRGPAAASAANQQQNFPVRCNPADKRPAEKVFPAAGVELISRKFGNFMITKTITALRSGSSG
jgi:hypothetical protein